MMIMKICKNCNKSFKSKRHPNTATYCSRKCMGNDYRKTKIGQRKPGRIWHKDGWLLYIPNHPMNAFGNHSNYVYEHRYIMSQKVGRMLRSDEIVHHINHDHFDNSPDNLMITTSSAHAIHHNLKHIHCSEYMCGKPHWAKGLCNYHYTKKWRTNHGKVNSISMPPS